ncbi:MAG TPA: ABC transporter ATP-binding protein [Actinomycetota bacterium]|nr:ABC transporter ATP-binding protein [Actinomycetota bacterium]
MTTDAPPLLDVRDLRITFSLPGRLIHAVRGITFEVRGGERIGVVGESGSGKSATALAIMRLLPRSTAVTGQILLDGVDLLQLSSKEIRTIRGRAIGIVYQDPFTALNPVLTVGQQVAEVISRHFGTPRQAARREAANLLLRVGISSAADRLDDYPHQFSGGMRQRVMIAIALAGRPRLIIADEPTTALDVTIQAQILELLLTLTQEDNTALLLITHDLAVIARAIERVNVMYAGHIVEQADTRTVFKRPNHPYTNALLSSLPRVDDPSSSFTAIAGQPPDPSRPDTGCPYVDRCDRPLSYCADRFPGLDRTDPYGSSANRVACWNPVNTQ